MGNSTMLAPMNHTHRNDMRRHSDVLYMARNQTDRRQKVRRQSYAINQEARAGLNQLRSVRREVLLRRPESFDNNFQSWQPERNSEGARRMKRADPTMTSPKKIQVLIDSKPSDKPKKINKRCPSCKTRNVFPYTLKKGSKHGCSMLQMQSQVLPRIENKENRSLSEM
eukprot:TRINITY_DN223_c0_g1_i5.p1 TRINITY_DN223_c0_g1~~TRINITY_DN223_c0_g1_i5.p1  ORF type:complete len:187 (+),score=29.31 TRINITY_DN223_c0_g1_i5:59-562(+)